MCALADSGKPPPLPSALKQNKTKLKQTKPNKFSSVHTRECLASATEQHSYCVSLSIKWHAHPLPRKILVPNTNHAPWLPSSVYSSRTAIHLCSHLKNLKLLWGNLSPMCWQELGYAPETMPAIARERTWCLSLSRAPSQWRNIIAVPWGVTSRALVSEEDCPGTNSSRN